MFQPYSPEPLGNDLVAQFGDDFSLPLFGNFDPPVDGGRQRSLVPRSVDQPAAIRSIRTTTETSPREMPWSSSTRSDEAEIDTSVNPLRLVRIAWRLPTRCQPGRNGFGTRCVACDQRIGPRNSREPESEPARHFRGWANLADQAVADLDDGDDELLDLLASDSSRIF